MRKMKKVISLFLSLLFAASMCSGFSAYAASEGASFDTASPVYQGTSYRVSVSGLVEKEVKSWSRFDCTASGYYDFTCTGTALPTEPLHITVYDVNKNIVNYAVNYQLTQSVAACTYLTAGGSYYFCVEYDGGVYEADITVTQHVHSYSCVQTVAACADDDAQNRNDGFVRYICPACSSYYDSTYFVQPSLVALSSQSLVYNGNPQYPTVTVYDKNGAVIPESNYTLTYEDNILPGRACVTVSFTSPYYTGEMTKSFIILPKKQSVSSLKAGKTKAFTVKWTKDTAVDGYEIQYSTSSKFYKSKTKTITVTNKNTSSKSVSKLQMKKKYHVRVRAYKNIDGIKNYGAWSSVKKIYIKK